MLCHLGGNFSSNSLPTTSLNYFDTFHMLFLKNWYLHLLPTLKYKLGRTELGEVT